MQGSFDCVRVGVFRVLRRVSIGAAGAVWLVGCASMPGLQDDAARVRAEAERATEAARQAARPATQCAAKPGTPFAYRKKVLLLAAQVRNPGELPELPGLGAVWGQALSEGLRAGTRLLIHDGGGYRIDAGSWRSRREQVRELADRFGVQFVVAVALAAGPRIEHRLRFDSAREFMRSLVDRDDRRALLIETEVYDRRGVLIEQMSRHARTPVESGRNARAVPLAAGWLETEAGGALRPALRRQIEDIEDALACLPLEARLVRVDWRDLHIDAGFTSGLAQGDRLRLYRRLGWTLSPQGDAQWQEEAYGQLVLKTVYPETAIGAWEGGERQVDPHPGHGFHGVVRAW